MPDALTLTFSHRERAGVGVLRAEALLQRPHQRLPAVFQRHHAFTHVFAELLEIGFLILPLVLDRGLQSAQATQYTLQRITATLQHRFGAHLVDAVLKMPPIAWFTSC